MDFWTVFLAAFAGALVANAVAAVLQAAIDEYFRS
jgi:hypothetical protein